MPTTGLDLRILSSEALKSAHRSELKDLLEAAFEGSFTEDDWAHTFGGTHALLIDEETDALLAHASVVPRRLWIDEAEVDAGYVEAVAVRADQQGRGRGTRVMRALEPALDQFPLCALSTSSHAFYTRLGWRRWRGPSWVRNADGTRRRSPEEDGGIMVRPTDGAMLLTEPISCEARIGDDW